MNRATVRAAVSVFTIAALGALLSNGEPGMTGRAAGDPGDNPDATFDLLTLDGGASIAYRGGSPGECHDMSDYGLDEPARQIDLQGPGVGTAVLRLYAGTECQGHTRDIQAAGDAVVTVDLTQERFINSSGMWAVRHSDGMRPRSYRVVVTEPQAIPSDGSAEGCATRGETLIDNGYMTVSLGEDGRLGLFRRDAQTGALDPVGKGVDSQPAGVTGWDQACIRSGGLSAQTQISMFDIRTWASMPGYQEQMELTADCKLIMRNTEWVDEPPRVLFDAHCFDDMRLEIPEIAPSMSLLFANIDDEESPEMILDVRAPDGSGYLMTDPMGIASTLYAAGEEIGPYFYMALSETQKDAVREQTLVVTRAGGAAGINALLTAVTANPNDIIGNFVAFPYTYTTEQADADFHANGQVGDAEVEFWFNRRQYHLKTDANGISARMEVTTAEAELTAADGYATLNVKAGVQMAEFTVVKDGFVIGAGADAIAVSFTGGRQDRSHITIGVSYGEGALVAASWGRGGLYGFSLQVPKFPVSIAIYVHKDDAVQVHGQAMDFADDWGRWNREAARDTALFARRVVSEMRRELDDANQDVRVAVQSAELEAGIYLGRVGNHVTIAVKTAAGQVQSTVEGAAHEVEAVLDQTVYDIGNAITAAAGDAARFAASIGTAVDGAIATTVNALNQAAGGVEDAVHAVVKFFDDLF